MALGGTGVLDILGVMPWVSGLLPDVTSYLDSFAKSVHRVD